MTKHDTGGDEFDEDEGDSDTTDKPAEARIHKPHLAVIRLGKAALVAALEAGAVLQQERNRRGDDFEDWVDRELALSRDEADCYIRFYEESCVRPEQLSPVVEVKLPRVLGLLGQLHATYGEGATPTQHAGTAGRANRGQSKPHVGSNVDKQSSKPNEAASQPTKASERAKTRTTKATAKAKPVQQDRDDRQSALTAEQEQLLMRRSPRLLARVCNGKLTPKEALCLAKDLPDRNVPQPS